MKVCNKCEKEKPLVDFHNNKANGDGKERRCKKCRSDYSVVLGARESTKLRKTINRNAFRDKNRVKLKALLEKSKCFDCGEKNWVVLEFDHLRDKKFEISRMILDRQWSLIEKEIAKCDIVCANCYRVRTYNRARSWRATELVQGGSSYNAQVESTLVNPKDSRKRVEEC